MPVRGPNWPMNERNYHFYVYYRVYHCNTNQSSFS